MAKPARQQSIAKHRAPTGVVNGLSIGRARPSQRERLLAAATELALRKGYGEISVADLTSGAGVSRTTFYELFDEKEDCFLVAYREATRDILEQIERGARRREWPDALAGALAALLGWLERKPGAGWLLMIEGMAAGAPRLREARRHLFAQFEQFTENYLDHPPEEELTLDIPALALAGGARAVIARRLNHNAPDRLPSLEDGLLRWMRSYAIPPGTSRWSTGPQAHLSAGIDEVSNDLSILHFEPPLPLPRGNHGLSSSEVARNRRARLLYATAEVTSSKGYLEMTVADIVASASVARDVFYEHFHDKQEAFLEAQAQNVQIAIAGSTNAFFAGRAWPERIWSTIQALTEMIAGNPSLAHLVAVESFAAGRAAHQRMEEVFRTLSIFLEDGYHLSQRAYGLPRLCSEAIVGAIFEILYSEIAFGEPKELPRYVPQLSYIAIAPFAGPVRAARVVEGILARQAASPSTGAQDTTEAM